MLSFFRIELEFIARMKPGRSGIFWNIVRPFNELWEEKKNTTKKKRVNNNNTRYQSWRDTNFVATSGTKPRRKYTPGLKNSRTSLFLSSYLDRLLRSVRYRESHTFWTALCNERAREVCPHNGARGKHPLFNPFVYFFSSRKQNTNLAPDDSYIKETSHKTKQKKEEQTNEKQHFTPEDLFPFYYPSKTPEREYT